jgi:hypothetical protein
MTSGFVADARRASLGSIQGTLSYATTSHDVAFATAAKAAYLQAMHFGAIISAAFPLVGVLIALTWLPGKSPPLAISRVKQESKA